MMVRWFRIPLALALLLVGCNLSDPGGVALDADEVARVKAQVSEVRGLDWQQDVPVAAETQAQREGRLGPPPEVAVGGEGTTSTEDEIEDIGFHASAYYDPEAGCISFATEGLQGGIREELTLAHEFGHALDDQVYGLPDMADVSFDEALARRCVAEGSAQVTAFLHVVHELARSGKRFPDYFEARMRAIQQSGTLGIFRGDYIGAPPVQVAPYFLGYAFFTAECVGRDRAVMEALEGDPRQINVFIQRAMEQPPNSMSVIIHPEKFWTSYAADAHRRPVVLPAEALGDGWQLDHEDTLGEYVLCLQVHEFPTELEDIEDVTEEERRRMTPAHVAASVGWDGDRYAHYKGPDEQAFGVWWTLWEDGAERDEFLAAATRLVPERDDDFLLAEPLGDDGAVLYYTIDVDAPDALLARVREQVAAAGLVVE